MFNFPFLKKSDKLFLKSIKDLVGKEKFEENIKFSTICKCLIN